MLGTIRGILHDSKRKRKIRLTAKIRANCRTKAGNVVSNEFSIQSAEPWDVVLSKQTCVVLSLGFVKIEYITFEEFINFNLIICTIFAFVRTFTILLMDTHTIYKNVIWNHVHGSRKISKEKKGVLTKKCKTLEKPKPRWHITIHNVVALRVRYGCFLNFGESISVL